MGLFVWELLKTVSLPKSDIRKQIIRLVKLVKTKKSCKKDTEKIRLSKIFNM